MATSKKPSLDDILSKETDTAPKKVTTPPLRDGMLWLPEEQPIKPEEINASGNVHVWTENPDHNLPRLAEGVVPQKPNPDAVGYGNAS